MQNLVKSYFERKTNEQLEKVSEIKTYSFFGSKKFKIISMLLIFFISIVIFLILNFEKIPLSNAFNILKEKETIKIISNLNQLIYTGNEGTNNTIISINTSKNIDYVQINSNCTITKSFLGKKEFAENFLYIFKITFKGDCKNPIINVGNKTNTTNDSIKLKSLEYSNFLNNLLDLSKETLINEKKKLDQESTKMTKKIKDLNKKECSKTSYLVYGSGTLSSQVSQTIELNYEKKLYNLKSSVIKSVLDNAEIKYKLPVPGYRFSTRKSAIPNSAKDYRKDITDGIHHGWDIFAPLNTPVVATGKGIVIRIQNGFSWQDFDKIKRGSLTEDDELLNLDILRGNQVWLKTLDGNVTIYAHLSKINPNLKIGKIINSGDYIGNIGVSGVPDKDFADFHLHFEIQLNPKNKQQNNNLDIMRWNFLGKGLDMAQILLKQQKLFNQ
ncbi:MAG: M23 family metallopeptidase [Candidatus Gracilibacteria bacterium]|nr:M23 family metallopeptidase [Candidatus Gracilibacteria bacterium]